MNTNNIFNDQPAEIIDSWQAAKSPQKNKLIGEYCTLERLNAEKHSHDLHQAYCHDSDNALWRFLPYGPFANETELHQFLISTRKHSDPLFYAIIDKHSQRAIGFIAYLRINPNAGSIEIGHVCYSPLLQRTTAATEANFLLIQHCFDMGYRRCEWKCNSRNQASINAAQRLGFQYEGTFRQAMVVKGCNRDTAWFSIIDKEWSALKSAHLQWLRPSNFDAQGKQKKTLAYFKP